MMKNKSKDQKSKISNYIKQILILDSLSIDSLYRAVSNLSSITTKPSNVFFSPLTKWNDSDNSQINKLVIAFPNYKLILEQHPYYDLIILIPLLIYEYKYIVFFNRNSIGANRKWNTKSKTSKQQKPTISITFIETNTPEQFINYQNITDINFFFQQTKQWKSQDNTATFPQDPTLRSLKKNLLPNESIQGKSFNEIYDTVLQIRNKKKKRFHESHNNVVFSSLLKKRSNGNNNN